MGTEPFAYQRTVWKFWWHALSHSNDHVLFFQSPGTSNYFRQVLAVPLSFVRL
jgi:hypothetical protein